MQTWWQTGVIYQIYPRSYMDSNNDGIGDLPGVMRQLDYLQWLGIDAIWFSPTFPSPMKDFGYDVADYRAVHPDFGTLNDFDALLTAANERGIRILLDLVPNHTSDQHAWFIESRSSRDNPKRDWYIWRDPKPDGSPPNNWRAFFKDESAWAYDDTTGQYYLHSFLKEQPDLNWRNPDLRQAMYDNIRFWLDRGVAGFRVDVIDIMIKDEQLRDEPLNPNYDPAVNIPRDQLLHIYSAYQDEVHDVIREMRQVFDEYQDRVFIGELTYEISIEKYLTYFGDDDELMIPFNFMPLEKTLWGKTLTAGQLQAFSDEYHAALGVDHQASWVFGNHDVPRLASRVGEQARVYAMFTLTQRGTPFIYQGEELGIKNVDVPPEKMQDPFGINFPSMGRDGCRTPMQWDTTPNAGFTAPDVEPWLPLSSDYARVNVAVQQADSQSFLSLYKRLLAIRRDLPALHKGLYYPVQAPPTQTVAYLRQYNDQRVLIVLNFSGDKRTVNIDGLSSGHVLLSTLLDRDDAVDLSALRLRPYEGVVVRVPFDA